MPLRTTEFFKAPPNLPSPEFRFPKSPSHFELVLGDCREMMYRTGLDFHSYSRRGNRHIVDYVTVAATRKTDEKTNKNTSVPTL